MGLAILIFLVVAAAVLWYIAVPLLREDAAESERVVSANSEAVDLQSRHAMLIAALADVEEDRSTAKLDDEDYEHLKADLSAKAIDVLKKMDALENRPPAPPPGPRRLDPTGDKPA